MAAQEKLQLPHQGFTMHFSFYQNGHSFFDEIAGIFMFTNLIEHITVYDSYNMNILVTKYLQNNFQNLTLPDRFQDGGH